MKIIFLSVLISLSMTVFSQDRKGFLFGASAGLAHSNIRVSSSTQSNTDLGLNWKVGYMIRPNLAVLINGSASIYDYTLSGRARKRDFGGIFPSAQYWVADKIWILGGGGIGTDAPVFYDLKVENIEETKYHSGIGAISSIGYEVYRKKNFALDVQARLNFSGVDLPVDKAKGFTTALLLGFNFY